MTFTYSQITIFFLFFSFCNSLTSQTFDRLDPNFGDEGKVIIYEEEAASHIAELTIQQDGKLLLIGSFVYPYSLSLTTGNRSDFYIARLRSHGQMDESFGENGVLKTTFGYHSEQFMAVMELSDGKIFMMGQVVIKTGEEYDRKNAFVRYLSDGSLDKTFGENGIILVNDDESSTYNRLIDLPDSDNFLMTNYVNWKSHSGAAFRRFSLVGFLPDGSINQVFGNNGKISYDKTDFDVEYFNDVAVYNNQLYLAGTQSINRLHELALVRFDLNGQLDTLFGERGISIAEFKFNGGTYPEEIQFQEDGKILICANAVKSVKADFGLARFNNDGSLDTSFGNGGKVTTEFTDYSAIAIQSNDEPIKFFQLADGKILVIGYSYKNGDYTKSELALARYHHDGTLDLTFGNKGKMLMTEYSPLSFYPQHFVKQSERQMIFSGKTRYSDSDKYNHQLIRFLTDLNVGTIALSQNPQETFVYPNPIQATATLKYVLEQPENLTIQLMDVNGRLLKTYLQNKLQQAGSYQQQIDLPTYLSTGVYFLKMISTSGQLSIKVTKSN